MPKCHSEHFQQGSNCGENGNGGLRGEGGLDPDLRRWEEFKLMEKR